MNTIVLQNDKNSLALLKALLFTMLLLSLTSISWGEFLRVNQTSDRRVKISLSIFPRVVAVDYAFKDKLTSKGEARMVIVYNKDRQKAAETGADFIAKGQSVAGKAMDVVLMSADEVIKSGVDEATAFFLAERVSNLQLYGLIKYAVKRKRILFSPFKGDVERGATAGIAVTSRVKPYFNMATLNNSNIKINDMLMKLSKQYD